MEIRNAQIDFVRLSVADFGCLTFDMMLSYGDSECQGFGTYQLYYPNNKMLLGTAGIFIWRILKTAGVSEWRELEGKFVRVRIEDKLITAIGNILEDKWFCPKEEFKDLD